MKKSEVQATLTEYFDTNPLDVNQPYAISVFEGVLAKLFSGKVARYNVFKSSPDMIGFHYLFADFEAEDGVIRVEVRNTPTYLRINDEGNRGVRKQFLCFIERHYCSVDIDMGEQNPDNFLFLQ